MNTKLNEHGILMEWSDTFCRLSINVFGEIFAVYFNSKKEFESEHNFNEIDVMWVVDHEDVKHE